MVQFQMSGHKFKQAAWHPYQYYRDKTNGMKNGVSRLYTTIRPLLLISAALLSMKPSFVSLSLYGLMTYWPARGKKLLWRISSALCI